MARENASSAEAGRSGSSGTHNGLSLSSLSARARGIGGLNDLYVFSLPLDDIRRRAAKSWCGGPAVMVTIIRALSLPSIVRRPSFESFGWSKRV
jgi:hypothetical protein